VILHINTSKEWRGGENQTFYLVSGLAQRNVPQIILVQPDSPLLQKIQSIKSLRIISFPMRSEFDWIAIREIRKIIQENSVRIVHTHTAQAHSLAFFAKRDSDPWKLLISRRVDFRVNKNLFSKWKYHSKKVDMYVTVSDKIRSILIEDGIQPRKVITIRSGVDLSRFAKLPSKEHSRKEVLQKELQMDTKTIILGIIAALVDHKDYPTLLKAVSLIPESYKICLLIFGIGELQSDLEALVDRLEIRHRVLFLGFREDIIPYLNTMDIFCFSSKEEGLGTSVLDAMSCGLPVVATKAGGIPEMIVHGEGGFLVEIGDFEGFANALVRLIRDDSLRTQMGLHNKSRVTKFGIEETIDKTYRLYYSYLGSHLAPDAPLWKKGAEKAVKPSRKSKQLSRSKTTLNQKPSTKKPSPKKHAKKN